MPALFFCIAFGLSMDYEVFLVSRIQEYWLASNRTPADNDESVALGLAHTGRVITAAALIMSISFAAMIAAQVSFMRMFGVGLDAGRAGRRDAGTHATRSGLHARDGPDELVGPQTACAAA